MNRFKELDDIHCQGSVNISEDFKMFSHDLQDVDLGLKIGFDGRLWICINGISFLRFKPKMNEE